MPSRGCFGTRTRPFTRPRWKFSHLKSMVARKCWLLKCNPAATRMPGANRCANACKARHVVLRDRWRRHIRDFRMNSLKSLFFRRRDMDGLDVFFPPRMAGMKSFLFQLVPTRYRAQKYNRQLRREIEERPDGALIVWERDSSAQLYYVFHGMAGGLGIQPLTVLRETGLIHNNLVL